MNKENSTSRGEDAKSVADFLGPWAEPDWDSGLIERCRNAWNKPLRDLSNQEMATLLRQRIVVKQLLPIASKRVQDRLDDGTELYDGELKSAIEHVRKTENC